MEGDLQRQLGRNLRAYRVERGLSQEAFAVTLSVHRTYMGGLERWEENLPLKSVERLAERLGVEPLQPPSLKATGDSQREDRSGSQRDGHGSRRGHPASRTSAARSPRGVASRAEPVERRSRAPATVGAAFAVSLEERIEEMLRRSGPWT